MKRPTIAQLEAILEKEEQVELEILPNGEVRVQGTTPEIPSSLPASKTEPLLVFRPYHMRLFDF